MKVYYYPPGRQLTGTTALFTNQGVAVKHIGFTQEFYWVEDLLRKKHILHYIYAVRKKSAI